MDRQSRVPRAVEMGDEVIGAGMVMLAQRMPNCPARGEHAEEHAMPPQS